jgi:hypothetical protein
VFRALAAAGGPPADVTLVATDAKASQSASGAKGGSACKPSGGRATHRGKPRWGDGRRTKIHAALNKAGKPIAFCLPGRRDSRPPQWRGADRGGCPRRPGDRRPRLRCGSPPEMRSNQPARRRMSGPGLTCARRAASAQPPAPVQRHRAAALPAEGLQARRHQIRPSCRNLPQSRAGRCHRRIQVVSPDPSRSGHRRRAPPRPSAAPRPRCGAGAARAGLRWRPRPSR